MASNAIIASPLLARFREALTAIYRDRLERIVLFGSRARDDARPDSDYDVAVFLRDIGNRFQELYWPAHVSTDLINATGEVVNAVAYASGAYNERTPLMREIRLEGIDL